MSAQDLQRTSGGNFSCPCMVHTDLVPYSSPNVKSTTQVVDLDPPARTSDASIRQSPLMVCLVSGNIMKTRAFLSTLPMYSSIHGDLLHNNSMRCILKNGIYSACRARKIPSHSTTLNHILEFLYTQLHLSYSSLNTARSALSCFLTINNHPVEKHPLVCRFLKGAFEKKPPPNRHYAIWDVKTVLAYLKTFTPNSSLNLKEISHKLVMLLALVSIQRKQTLVHVNINNNYMVKSDNQFVFKPGFHMVVNVS